MVLVEVNVSEFGIGYADGFWVKGRQHASEVGTCRIARIIEVPRGRVDPRAFRNGFWEHASVCVFFTLHFIPGWVEQGGNCHRAEMSL